MVWTKFYGSVKKGIGNSDWEIFLPIWIGWWTKIRCLISKGSALRHFTIFLEDSSFSPCLYLSHLCFPNMVREHGNRTCITSCVRMQMGNKSVTHNSRFDHLCWARRSHLWPNYAKVSKNKDTTAQGKSDNRTLQSILPQVSNYFFPGFFSHVHLPAPLSSYFLLWPPPLVAQHVGLL